MTRAALSFQRALRYLNFKLTSCRFEFDGKKKNNNKLVGSYLTYAYNHIL